MGDAGRDACGLTGEATEDDSEGNAESPSLEVMSSAPSNDSAGAGVNGGGANEGTEEGSGVEGGGAEEERPGRGGDSGTRALGGGGRLPETGAKDSGGADGLGFARALSGPSLEPRVMVERRLSPGFIFDPRFSFASRLSFGSKDRFGGALFWELVLSLGEESGRVDFNDSGRGRTGARVGVGSAGETGALNAVNGGSSGRAATVTGSTGDGTTGGDASATGIVGTDTTAAGAAASAGPSSIPATTESGSHSVMPGCQTFVSPSMISRRKRSSS